MIFTLPRFSRFTAVCTFFLLVAGALVTSTGSGLAVPDWPLSFGQFFPRMEGGVLFEHGHRMIAGGVGILTAVLTIRLWLEEKRRWICKVSTVALGTVFLQALLGGATVLLKLPPQVSIAHAVMAQTFFCLVVALAFFESSSAENPPSFAFGNPAVFLSGALMVLLFIQLILGAALRHLGSMIYFYFHASQAGLILILSFVLLKRSSVDGSGESRVRKHAKVLFSLLLAQVTLGIFSAFPAIVPLDLSWLARTIIVTSHVVIGALLLATSVFTFLESAGSAS